MYLIQVAAISIVAAIDPQCQTFIDANAQALDLIRTIQVNYILTWIDDASMPAEERSWSREGRRERIHGVPGDLKPTADGRPHGILDLLIDGDTYKCLWNWDTGKPQKITPTAPGTVRAEVAPYTRLNVGDHSPSRWFLFEVDSIPRRTLSELAKVSPSVDCKGKVKLDGRELWLISLETPEETTATTGKSRFDVYLDPMAGYMIHTLVVNSDVMQQPEGKVHKDSHAHQVAEFKDFGNGIFVPMRIRNGDLGHWLTEFVVKSIKVNEPIPPETFEMKWPKYSQVRHLPPVNGRARVEIWGDGKPLGEFGSHEELIALEARLRQDPVIAAELGPLPGAPRPAPASLMMKLSIGLGALVAIMIALVLYRRIREQAAA